MSRLIANGNSALQNESGVRPLKNHEGDREEEVNVGMIDANDVARIIGISRRSLDRLRSQGIVPPPDFTHGKIIRWWPQTIYRYLGLYETEAIHGS